MKLLPELGGEERRGLKLLYDKRIRELLWTDPKRNYKMRLCSGCGCEWSARSIGCRPCENRATKRARRRRGNVALRARTPGLCIGCGAALHTTNWNCETCRERDKKRRHRTAA